MLPAPTVDDLSTFTGRPAASFGVFASQALAQATLMFSVLTRLAEYPDDPDLEQLAKNAIMEMSDRLILEQPYQAIKAGPFQSESIGSYSYSRRSETAVKAQAGLKTGLFWWDTALDELTLPGQSVLAHGSIDTIPDGLVRRPSDGNWTVMNAADEDGWSGPPYVRIS